MDIMKNGVFGVLLLLAATLSASAQLNPSERWQIRQYFQAVYSYGTETAMEWQGDYDSRQPGSISAVWQEAVRTRIRYYREMAGVPGEVSFNPTWSAAAQEAALMMSLENKISHTPTPDWIYYTENGALAASRSNLAYGSSGPDAIDGYMIDFGQFNAAVGHRRWLLFPQTKVMGNGDIPGDPLSGLPETNALWVIPDSLEAPPPTRDPYVAWPPRGFVPANVTYGRWSFSLPDADFSQATVSMTHDGTPLPVALEPIDSRLIGDPTLVWVPEGMRSDNRFTWPTPVSDTVLGVSVQNVLVAGIPENFQYEVIVFDPDQPGPSEVQARVESLSTVYPTVPAPFRVSLPPWSEAVQGRLFTVTPYTLILGAEEPESPFEANISSGYLSVQASRVASGERAFYLALPEVRPQTLTLKGTYLIGADTPSMEFKSSIAYATATQIATVELNPGDGENWFVLWEKTGPIESNPSFNTELIDLTPYSEMTIRLRFRYDLINPEEIYYPQTEPHVGWAIDDIRFQNVSKLLESETFPKVMDSDRFVAAMEGDEITYLQGRGFAFGGFALDWGPAVAISPQPYAPEPTQPHQWTRDPVLGWVSGTGSDWIFSYVMGWIHLGSFPWIYAESGWFYYLRGSVESTLWLYHPEWGLSYTNTHLGGWFNHDPFDDTSWKTFRN